MAFRPVSRCSGRSLVSVEPCIRCHTRQLYKPLERNASRTSSLALSLPSSRRRYIAANARGGRSGMVQKSPQQVREEYDYDDRTGYYALAHRERLIAMDPQVADQIYTGFVKSPNQADFRNKVLELASKHKLKLSDITHLALVTYRTPNTRREAGRLPPSQHKTMSKRLLLACSEAGDSEATLHILRAVYWSPSLPMAKDIASQFSPVEVRECRHRLEALATAKDLDGMTLLGQFLEQEGHKPQAKELYEQALMLVEPRFDPNDYPLTLPQIPPWNALGTLLLAEKNPQSQEQARAAFRKGAHEADDSLSYYYLASFEKRYSGAWLQCMTKAAAAGHLEAMSCVADFYKEANSYMSGKVDGTVLKDGILAQALHWLTDRKRDAPKQLGMEWLQAAASGGHKPSMQEIAELEVSEGNKESAIEWLERITEPPADGKAEQWPQLIGEARKRLQRLKLQARIA